MRLLPFNIAERRRTMCEALVALVIERSAASRATIRDENRTKRRDVISDVQHEIPNMKTYSCENSQIVKTHWPNKSKLQN